MLVNLDTVGWDAPWDGPPGPDHTPHVIREILPLVLRRYGIDSPCEPAAADTSDTSASGLECSS